MKCQCGKIAIKGRKQCSACKSRNYREKYPLKAAFYIKKANAKHKRKEFNLTFEQFEYFAIKSQYLKKKGIFKDSFHLDRIREDIGYVAGNLQLLTNSQNVKKYLEYKWDDNERKMKAKIITTKGILPTCEAF
jgi:hypothetical protein